MAKKSGRERQQEPTENSAELEASTNGSDSNKRQSRAQAIAKKAEQLQSDGDVAIPAAEAKSNLDELEIDDMLADALSDGVLEDAGEDVDDFMLSALMAMDVPMGAGDDEIEFDDDALAALTQLANDLEDERSEDVAESADVLDAVAESTVDVAADVVDGAAEDVADLDAAKDMVDPETAEALEAISLQIEQDEPEEVNAERLVEELVFKQEIDSTFETGRGVLPPPGVLVPDALKETIESKEPMPEVEVEAPAPDMELVADVESEDAAFEPAIAANKDVAMPVAAAGDDASDEVSDCRLLIYHEGKGPRILEMKSDVMVVGRHPDCEVMLLDKGVSREHVRLTREGAEWKVVDLNSTNGSFLGYSRLSRKFSVAWDKGTELRVGPFALTWEVVEAGASSSAENTFIDVIPEAAVEAAIAGDAITIPPSEPAASVEPVKEAEPIAEVAALDEEVSAESETDLPETDVSELPEMDEPVAVEEAPEEMPLEVVDEAELEAAANVIDAKVEPTEPVENIIEESSSVDTESPDALEPNLEEPALDEELEMAEMMDSEAEMISAETDLDEIDAAFNAELEAELNAEMSSETDDLMAMAEAAMAANDIEPEASPEDSFEELPASIEIGEAEEAVEADAIAAEAIINEPIIEDVAEPVNETEPDVILDPVEVVVAEPEAAAQPEADAQPEIAAEDVLEAELDEAGDMLDDDMLNVDELMAMMEEETPLPALDDEAEPEAAANAVAEAVTESVAESAVEEVPMAEPIAEEIEDVIHDSAKDMFDVVDLDAPHNPVVVPELDEFLFEAQVSDEQNALQALRAQIGKENDLLQEDSLAGLIAQIDAGVVGSPVQPASRRARRNYTNRTAMVVFELSETQYAVSVDYVLELSDFGRITPVPFVPEWVLGVTNLRGEILSVIDLRVLLGVEATPLPIEHQMMIIEMPDQNVTVGVIVDEIRGYRQLESANSDEFTGHINDHIEPYIDKLYQYQGQLVAEMKFDKVLAAGEVA